MRARIWLLIGFLAVIAAATFVTILLLSLNESRKLNVGDVVPNICENAEPVTSFDVTIRIEEDSSAPWDKSVRKISIEGEDSSVSWIVTGLAIPLVEWVRKGDSFYIRTIDDDGEWEVHEGGDPIDLSELFPSLGDNPVCPEVGGFLVVGEEDVDDIKVMHYASLGFHDVAGTSAQDIFADVATWFRGEKKSAAYELWVSEGGQLLQHKAVTHRLKQTDREREVYTLHTTTRVSGVGEPNTITAPAKASTPRPRASNRDYCITLPSDYDVTVTGHVPYGKVHWESRVSGDDEHRRYMELAPQGILVVRAEEIRKNGVLYTRENPDDDSINFGEWVSQDGEFQAETPPCSQAGVGQSSSSSSGADEGTKNQKYWFDPDGFPTRGQITITPPDATDPSIELDYVYSGWGEPNVISAPDVSSP